MSLHLQRKRHIGIKITRKRIPRCLQTWEPRPIMSLMASYPPTSGRKHKRKCHFCKGPHLLKFCTEKPDVQQQNQVPWEEISDEEMSSPQSIQLAEPDAEATDEELPLQEEEYQELKQTLEQELEMSFHVSYRELHEFDDDNQM